MKTIFLAFANRENSPLANLRAEDVAVDSALAERADRKDFQVMREQYATRDLLIQKLSRYQQELCIFLYSGHAGRDHLLLEDGDAQADGIAALLGRCPNLQLVLLNGCSTAGQVDALLHANIPMVIATSAPIDDETAKVFSIQFFTELSKNRRSVREAFVMAIDAAKVYGKIDAEIQARGAGRKTTDASAPSWGLYYQEEKSDLIDNWRLPSQPVPTTANQFLEKAITAIFEGQLKAQHEDSKGQDIVLKCLPYTISEPIRKLLAPRDGSGQLFYDQPSPERFRMLLYAYRSIINFAAFVLLSQLWAEKRKDRNCLDTATISSVLQQWLLADSGDDERHSLLPLFNTLAALFKAQQVPFFFGELEDVLAALDTPEIQDALSYLEKQIAENSQSDLEYRCEATEEHLAIVLYQFGFLVNYSLTSVKDIGVLFYMHDAAANYDHKIVRLQQQITALEDRSEISPHYYKTASVLLRHTADKTRALYLSPFLIDENAYTKTPKANLRYFIAFDKVNKYFHFQWFVTYSRRPGGVIIRE